MENPDSNMGTCALSYLCISIFTVASGSVAVLHAFVASFQNKTDVEQTHNRAEQGDNIVYIQKAGGLQLAMRVTLIIFSFFANTGLFVCGESSG